MAEEERKTYSKVLQNKSEKREKETWKEIKCYEEMCEHWVLEVKPRKHVSNTQRDAIVMEAASMECTSSITRNSSFNNECLCLQRLALCERIKSLASLVVSLLPSFITVSRQLSDLLS
jgi:hypothetical protein